MINKGKSPEQFKIEAIEKNNRLIVVGEYINQKTKVLVVCKKCGFERAVLPNSILRGVGCPKCTGKYQRTTKEFINELSKINPDIEVIGDFAKLSQGIKCMCKKCGHIWNPRAGNLIQNHSGCPICLKQTRGLSQRQTHEKFIEKVNKKSPNIEVLSVYQGSNNEVNVRCKICDYEWSPTAVSLVSGRSCPKCSHSYRRTHSEFVDEMKKISPEIIIVGEFVNTSTKTACKCNRCGYLWFNTPNHLLKGQGCPKCNGKYKTTDDFKKELKEIQPNIRVIGEYINSKSYIELECKICGNRWKAKPNNLLSGWGCPNCSSTSTSTSYMERYLANAFIKALENKEVLGRDKTLIGMELDIYIPELKLAIEPGAWKMHKNHLERDREKRQKCKEKGVRLITIYDSCDLNTPPFSYDCYMYKNDLAQEEENLSLRNIVRGLLDDYEVPFMFSENDWEFISKKAAIESRGKNSETFKTKLAKISPDIEILGIYRNSTTPILCKCKICDYEWSPISGNLLNNKSKCPKCSRKAQTKKVRKTTEQFIEEMKKVNPNIAIIGNYTTALTPIDCACKICNTKWSSKPNNLLNNHGCPTCARRKRKCP